MKAVLKFFYRMIFELGMSVLNIFPDERVGNRIRGKFVSLFAKGTKRNLEISKRVHILYPNNLYFGDDVFVGYGAWLNAQGRVDILSECMIGPYVCIASGNHTFKNGSYRFGEHSKSRVIVSFGSWLGAGVKVTPGVVIGERCVIAAGAVVNKSTIADALYVSEPGKLKRSLVEKHHEKMA